MARKSIEFKAVLNDTEFNNAIKRIQSQLKTAGGDLSRNIVTNEIQTKMRSLGISPGVSQQQQEVNQAKSVREMDKFIKDQYKQATQLNKALEDRAKQLKLLRDMEAKSLDDEKKKLEISQKIAETTRQQHELEKQHSSVMTGLSSSLNQRAQMGSAKPEGMDRIKQAYDFGGVGGAAKAGYRMMGGGLGLGLGAMGMLATGIGLAEPVIRSFGARDRVFTQAQGSAISGLSNTSDLYNNRLASTMYGSPERDKALQTALKELKHTRTADAISPYGSILSKVGIGAASGAAGGAIFGGIGAIPGMALGAAGGLLKGGYDVLADDRSRNSLMSPFSKGAENRLNAQQMAEFVSNFKTNEQSERAKDPLKFAAEDKYQRDLQRNLSFQRSMGLSNEGFYGKEGVLNKGFQQGFTEEQTMEAAQNIQSAGGSTRSSKENNVLANNITRSTNLTNAASLVGGMSRNLGSSIETENATIKLLSEGMKLGLDKSEFAAEQRKFSELTVSALQSAGVSSSKGAGEAMASFAAYGTDKTMAGIEGMSSAKDFMSAATSATGTPRGAIFAAKLMNDPSMKGLSFDTQAVLSQLPEERITSDNPIVQRAAEELGMDSGDVVKKVKGLKSDSVLVRQKSEGTRQNLQREYQKLKDQGLPEDQINENLQKNKEFNKLMSEMGAEDSRFVGLSNQAMKSVGMKLVKGELGSTDLEEAAKKSMTGPSGRMEDQSMSAIANQQSLVNENFLKMAPAMEAAAKAAATMTKEALEMQMKFQALIEKGEKVSAKDIQDILQYSNTTKPAVGKAK
jgi:hypothetical protein